MFTTDTGVEVLPRLRRQHRQHPRSDQRRRHRHRHLRLRPLRQLHHHSGHRLRRRPQPDRTAGGLYDRTTGFIKFGQRWYHPGTGRFTQQDSIEHLTDPAQGNRYAYAADNPVNYIDPTGEFGVFDAALIGFAVIGAVAGGIGIAAVLPGVVVSAALIDTSVALTAGIGIPSTVVGITCPLVESC